MSRSRASRVTQVATSQHNLPAALSTFVGRDNELRETRRLLGATRVLTLIGAGGVGKTRLAVHLGAAVLDAYPDGVWLVDLTPVAHPRRVARAVAGVLGLHERAGTPLLRLVADALQDKRVLLILDNCEHVLEACARLAEHLLRQLRPLSDIRRPRRPTASSVRLSFSTGKAVVVLALNGHLARVRHHDRAGRDSVGDSAQRRVAIVVVYAAAAVGRGVPTDGDVG